MAEKLPSWDLNFLFKSFTDPALTRALDKTHQRIRSFAKKYRGKLSKKIKTPAALAALLSDYENIVEQSGKPLQYAELRFAESCTDPQRGAFLQYIKTESQKLRNDLLFFELELSSLPAATLKTFMRAPACARFANFLHNIILSKAHRLSEAEEKIFEERDLTGRSAFLRLFDEALSRKKFTLTVQSKKSELSETEVLNLLYSDNRAVRKAAALSLTEGLQQESAQLGYIFNTLSADKIVEDRLRKYPSAEAARHLSNEISQEMVDTMANVVTEYYGLVQRFYKFKAGLLKVAKLADYDRYAPVTRGNTSITYARAREVVLASFRSFSPAYGKAAQRFFDENWIDAAKREGKRGGAFCSFVTADTHPLVFMNYTGSVREVFTLAHELGHGLHAYLMRDQGYLNFQTPLTVAETASVFAEMLLFAEFTKREKNPKVLLSMYINKIENIFATVFRQISMYRFEQDFHAARRKGELTVPEINALWRARQKEMFKDSITISPGYDYWWSYIPHFLHSPFYVYAYAFGELLTLSLYAKYLEDRAGFPEKYMRMLSLGSSQSPQELLKPFGVKLDQRSFWLGGMKVIEDLLEKAEELSSRK